MLPEAEGEIANVYAADTDSRAMRAWANLLTDPTFTYPQRAWARGMGRLSSDAYLYWFTWAPPIPRRENYGSFHGAFQMCVFGDLHAFDAVPTDADRRMAEVLARTGVRVARTGIPAAADFRHGRRIRATTKPTWSSAIPSDGAQVCAFRKWR